MERDINFKLELKIKVKYFNPVSLSQFLHHQAKNTFHKTLNFLLLHFVHNKVFTAEKPKRKRKYFFTRKKKKRKEDLKIIP